jgi:hypothetical protein
VQTYADRLAELRRFDSEGHYTHDGPVTGTDESASLQVTIDSTRRVIGVTAGRLPDVLRRPEGLDHAVRRAHTDAVMDKIEAGLRASGRIDATAPRRTAAYGPGAAPQVAELYPDFGHGPVDLELYRSFVGHQAADRSKGSGSSDNHCVTVTLDAAGPCGLVEADPGWLSQARSTQVAAAVLQAFEAAYRERDASHG